MIPVPQGRRSSTWGAIAVAALVVVLVGCTKDASDDADEPAIDAVPVIRSSSELVLPLDDFAQTEDQEHAITDAVNILGRQCMKRFGLDWPAARVSGSFEVDPYARRYSIIDVEKASVEGYHAVDIIKRQRALAELDANAPTPSREAMNVWAGRGQSSYNGEPVPAGGCAKEATDKLAGGVREADLALVQRLQVEARGRTMADSRVVKVFAAWSACMKDEGFSYPDPFAANDDQRWQSETISAEETATAVADVKCKDKANVVGTMLAVERAYQRRQVEQHGTELTAVKAYVQARAATAGRVLASGGA
ncbi:hypothetical protein [Phytohabitans aurantiacus]|uniref:Lipoprotein n=1 Tax=Phytohabitans aurantiacus TaxID=3016789 RepID=A0ABQ5QSR2_9ACTN|nr:hypothetical protein [Phytohabitans aurantiacus]GLH97643.1 hypothetical protein Pa4123_29180 [Phytohabitans aurantiacus]